MTDHLIRVDDDAYQRHLTGECKAYGPCAYCWQEYDSQESLQRFIEATEEREDLYEQG